MAEPRRCLGSKEHQKKKGESNSVRCTQRDKCPECAPVGLLGRSCQTNSTPGSWSFLGIAKRTVLSKRKPRHANLPESWPLAGNVGLFTLAVCFLRSATWGRKRLIYARQVRRWASANSGGSTLGPNRNATQKKINLSPSQQVRPRAKNGKSICPLGGWWTRSSRSHSDGE